MQLLYLSAVLATVFSGAQAQVLQTCYGYDQSVWTNNTVCKGSGACCNAEATCTAQRLCHNKGDPEDVFVRGPCSDRGWDMSICPQICRGDEGDNDPFPRVKQCPDGSWCCYGHDDLDSTTCCDQGDGRFLNERGEIVDPPASSSAVPVSTATPTTTAAPPSSGDDEGLSSGAKIGIGVGVGAGVLALIAIVFIVWYCMKRSRQAHHQNKDASSMDHLQPEMQDDVRAHYADHDARYGSQDGYYRPQNEYYKPAIESPPAEALGSIPGKMYSDHGRVEAGAGEVVGELPADVPTSTTTRRDDEPGLR